MHGQQNIQTMINIHSSSHKASAATVWGLPLSLLMSYTYGAPSKARNLTSYIYMDEIFYWGFCFLNRAFRQYCICVKNQQIHQLFIQFINYVW
jgi:hypothetical protein